MPVSCINLITTDADAVIQQFYPGELGGAALAEIVFGAANPSGTPPLWGFPSDQNLSFLANIGKLPVSFPHSVGTTPVFYNYSKGSRPISAGQVAENGSLLFGHQARFKLAQYILVKAENTDTSFVQYVLNTPVPLWSFGHGLSYTSFR